MVDMTLKNTIRLSSKANEVNFFFSRILFTVTSTTTLSYLIKRSTFILDFYNEAWNLLKGDDK